MAENSPLDVSTWIRKLGPDFKDSMLLMAFLASSLTIKLGWMSLFFVLLPIIGFILSMYFASMK